MRDIRGGGADPGWHIECSAMAEEIFGPAFEIHGGGLDLVFPHHENEVAQSRALGHPFAAIWTHNGMLRFTGEKMSKSGGYVATIRETIDEWGPEAVLVFFLTAHWRKPIDFSAETMAQAVARRDTLKNAFTLPAAEHDESGWAAFATALDDDFDTPAALAVLHEWASTRRLGYYVEVWPSLGSSRSPSASRRRPRSWSWPSAGRPPARSVTSKHRTGCGTSSPSGVGRCATSRAAATPSSGVTHDP